MNRDLLVLILVELRRAVRILTLMLGGVLLIAVIDGLYNLGVHAR